MTHPHDAWHTEMLQLVVEQDGPATVVSVAGEVDMLTAPQLAEALAGALDDRADGGVVAVDLSNVTFLDSHGLAVLDRASANSAADGAEQMRLVLGDARMVARLLHITDLEESLARYRTLADAIAGTDRLP